MTACTDLDLLLPLHATGALEPAEASRVEDHLAACASCRAEAARDAEVLSLAKLPPPSEAERRAVADVPRRAIAAMQRADRRRASWKRASVGFAVAAVALLAVLAPVLLQRPTHLPATTQVAWQEPDLDTVWDDSGVLDLSGAVASDDEADAVLAAVDF